MRINQVALLSPPWMNQTAGWKMDEIAEIWIGFLRDDGSRVVTYTTHTGLDYVDCILPIGKGTLGDIELVFSSSWKQD
jgi:hypothetical protein